MLGRKKFQFAKPYIYFHNPPIVMEMICELEK